MTRLPGAGARPTTLESPALAHLSQCVGQLLPAGLRWANKTDHKGSALVRARSPRRDVEGKSGNPNGNAITKRDIGRNVRTLANSIALILWQ